MSISDLMKTVEEEDAENNNEVILPKKMDMYTLRQVMSLSYSIFYIENSHLFYLLHL